VNEPTAPPASELNEFAAAIAHEIRTPLTAVAGEIEVALRRERTAEEYRAVLQRIAAPVAELVAISSDLALLSDPGSSDPGLGASAPFALVFAAIAARYAGSRDVTLHGSGDARARVAGEERRLGRAITLVIEHAIRYRKGAAPVSVRVDTSGDMIDVGVDAPSGFWPHAWSALETDSAGAASPLRLRTARRILADSGGALTLVRAAGTDAVHIQLHPC
jgi:signal transduction histidine kinase